MTTYKSSCFNYEKSAYSNKKKAKDKSCLIFSDISTIKPSFFWGLNEEMETIYNVYSVKALLET